MSISDDITNMVHRLKRYDIPIDRLAYELDECEWQELMEYVQGFQQYRSADLTYTDHMTFMGLKIRKKGQSVGGMQV